MFRALLEGVAFGTRTITDNFTRHGVAVDRIVVTGGVAEQNPLFLQILCDVVGRPIERAATAQACARGAAILGACAAGLFPSMREAIETCTARPAQTFTPDAAARAIYDRLYGLYFRLHEDLGRGGKVLHALRELALGKPEGERNPGKDL